MAFVLHTSQESKCEFKRLLAESVVRIKAAAHKLGNSIDAAKPYYESRIYAAQLAKETQQAASNHEKAKSIHAAAKEMVYLAEQGLGEKSTLDTACQEMLSHAASKVNQSQLEVTDTRNALKMCQLKLEVANNRVGKLQGQLKQALRASRYVPSLWTHPKHVLSLNACPGRGSILYSYHRPNTSTRIIWNIGD